MKKVSKKKDWKEILTPEQYHVMFEKGTERPFSGKYYLSKETGVYHCGACKNPLFTSKAKYDTGCGWPSFFEPVSKNALEFRTDNSSGIRRTEVICGKCGAHLGHVFPDGPKPTRQRYCINSVALRFRSQKSKKRIPE